MVRKFAKNDEGVSAVIGVILMVAITVILAAVIAAFVFSMSNGVSKPYTVGITIKKDTAGNIIVTNVGGPDVGQLAKVTGSYQVGSAPVAYIGDTQGTDGTQGEDITNLHNVGGSVMIEYGQWSADVGTQTSPQTHVIITAEFNDGKNQVIGEADV